MAEDATTVIAMTGPGIPDGEEARTAFYEPELDRARGRFLSGARRDARGTVFLGMSMYYLDLICKTVSLSGAARPSSRCSRCTAPSRS